MEIHYGFDEVPRLGRTAVAVGSFDGVHRGHRLLIGRLNEVAHSDLGPDGESVVVTFDPHPRQVLRGENRLLSTLPEKLDLLAETGVDRVVVVRFTPEFSRIDGETFLRDYLRGFLRAEAVLSGEDHHFGRDRSGIPGRLGLDGIRTANLGRYGNISSTAIRDAIEAGDMAAAAYMSGGGYLIRTDTLSDPAKLLPPPGDYLVRLSGRESRQTRLTIDPALRERTDLPLRIRVIGK